jgi:hypothetical protein
VGINDYESNEAIVAVIPNCFQKSVDQSDEYISLFMCRFNGSQKLVLLGNLDQWFAKIGPLSILGFNFLLKLVLLTSPDSMVH